MLKAHNKLLLIHLFSKQKAGMRIHILQTPQTPPENLKLSKAQTFLRAHLSI
jgi:hypothetical protein